MVKDPKTAELLAPKDHPIGTKRLCLDTNYYETYNRPTCRWSTCKNDPIQEITATGLRTRDARLRPVRCARLRHRLRRHDRRVAGDRHPRRGRTRAAQSIGRAARSPISGLMVSGFPNMFVVTGPGSPVGEDADDRWRSSSTSTGSPTAIDHLRASTSSTASNPRRTAQDGLGAITSTRLPTARSIRWPTPGMSAPTSRASRACSCPMSAASTATRRNATRWRRTAMRASP